MRIGMVGLGRMGGNMVRRLRRAGHECVGWDRSPEAVDALAREGVVGAKTFADLARLLPAPRAIWVMVPESAVDEVLAGLVPHLQAGDVVVDGGNSHWADDLRRSKELRAKGIFHVDVGTSGGVWGLERGYCLMIGGEAEAVARLDPVFSALAPGDAAAPRSPGRQGPVLPVERGYLHCGPAGAGHFVKMVHNGIEYGLMAAYAEGLDVLRGADAGKPRTGAPADAVAPREPERYRYDFDLAAITELWRRGSVVSSWLLDLAAGALHADPRLAAYGGRVSDSGEGRWTCLAAIDEGVPTPVLTAALHERFASRDRGEFAGKVLSAMRHAFGGHVEPPK